MPPKHPMISPRFAPLRGSVCVLCLIACSIAPGCTGSKVAGPRTHNPERVAMDDFVDRSAARADAGPPASPGAGAPGQPQNPPSDAAAPPRDRPDDGFTLTQSPPGATPPGSGIPMESSSPGVSDAPPASSPSLELLDAKVGDVNGKPIFTNSFFAPIEDRLIAEASRLSLSDWRRSAGQTIYNRLDGIITDELLRAEALASLTPTQRVGLQAFLNNFRTNLLSENLGSSQLASKRLQQQQGQTLDEALKQKELDTLVQITLFQEINRRVNVSWRDIKQRYERDIDKFSPPPTAIFRVIRAFKEDKDKVEQIQSRLDSGGDFVEIAAGQLNNYNPEADGSHTVPLSGSYEETRFFGPQELNEATQNLSIGESVGPVELGSSVYWIRLMDIQQESISLYDAQLQIKRDLNYERRREAQREYLDRLMERARVSSRDEVLTRLLQIAEERYGPRS